MGKWIVAALLTSVILACGGAYEDPYGEWRLSSLNDQTVLSQRQLTLELHDDYFDGFDGCNRFSGDYVYEKLEPGAEGSFFLRLGLRTEAGCPGLELMRQADEYLKALTMSVHYQVVDGDLEVLDHGGETWLVFVRENTLP